MQVSYGYLLVNNLAVCNLHEIIMSLLCKLLDAGFIHQKQKKNEEEDHCEQEHVPTKSSLSDGKNMSDRSCHPGIAL